MDKKEGRLVAEASFGDKIDLVFFARHDIGKDLLVEERDGGRVEVGHHIGQE